MGVSEFDPGVADNRAWNAVPTLVRGADREAKTPIVKRILQRLTRRADVCHVHPVVNVDRINRQADMLGQIIAD